jgi:hypothetical protein
MRSEAEMAFSLSPDIIMGVVVIAVALIVVYLFTRATKSTESETQISDFPIGAESDSPTIDLDLKKKRVNVPSISKTLHEKDVESARSGIRTLTLKQEILSMVMKRLFEAEDDGEITREERIDLTKRYEEEIKEVQEELERSELIVSLNELESIREDIVKKFESTLNSTQQRIDLIVKELDIKLPKVEAEPEREAPHRKPKKKPTQKIEEEEEEEDEEEDKVSARRTSDVEERLDKLKQEVLKELE